MARSVRPRDVYKGMTRAEAMELCQRRGFKPITFRYPVTGEYYLNPSGLSCLRRGDSIWDGTQVLILKRL